MATDWKFLHNPPEYEPPEWARELHVEVGFKPGERRSTLVECNRCYAWVAVTRWDDHCDWHRDMTARNTLLLAALMGTVPSWPDDDAVIGWAVEFAFANADKPGPGPRS